MQQCQLCNRDVGFLEVHHLVPKKFRSTSEDNKIYVCVDCSKMVHATFKLKELKTVYSNANMMKSHGGFSRYLNWVKNKPEGIVKHPRRTWKGGKYE